MSTPIRIESADEAALSAMLDHHAQLHGELESRLAELREAVAVSAPHGAAHHALSEFVDGHLLPHAAAEEKALYPAAKQNERAELLVESMILEHRDLSRKARQLRSAATPVGALSSAEALAAIFAVHVVKENDLLLPLLSRDPAVRLSALLHEMHDHLAEPAESAGIGSSGAVAEELDVRTLAHGARHEIIFGKLHALTPGGRLVIVNDHDPKPLRYQLEAAWPGQFDWNYVLGGPQVWRIEITKLS